ncbi:hypothetical protein D3C72_582230 [compost metagenome]
MVAVGEVGVGRLPHVDAADFAGLADVAVVAVDAHLRRPDGPPRAAGLGQRFVRVDHRHHARFAGRIGFMDDRPQPVDHRALEFGRAGSARRRHEAQGGQVERRPRARIQLQQAHIHDGHEVDGVDAVLLDQAQDFKRVEPRRQHQRVAHAQGHLREDAGRAVVDRRRQQRAAARPQAVGLFHHRLHRRQMLGQAVHRKRLAHHALGPAGRARGVRHVAARGDQGAVVAGLRVAPGVVIGAVATAATVAIAVAAAVATATIAAATVFAARSSHGPPICRDPQRGQAGGQCGVHLAPQIVFRDQHLGAAVSHQERHLVSRVMPVDGAVITTQPFAGLDDFQIWHAVAQQHRDDVAFAHAHRRQTRRDLLTPGHQRIARQAQVTGNDACRHAGFPARCALSCAVRASMAARAAAQSSSDQSKYCLK